MDSQKFSFLSQPNRWGLTAVILVFCIVFSPFVSVLAFIPRILTALPLLVLVCFGYVGPVSAIGCMVIYTAFFSMLFGPGGFLGGLLFFVPAAVVSLTMVEKEEKFWKATMISTGVMLVSEYLILLLVLAITGKDVVSAISGLFSEVIAESNLQDQLVLILSQFGAIAGSDGAAVDVATLTEVQKSTILKNFLSYYDQILRLEIPMQIATGAVSVGVLGQSLLRKSLLSRGIETAYPRMRTWRLPKGWGRVLGITALVLLLLSELNKNITALSYVFSGLFQQIFALQGIAALGWVAHKQGRGKGTQALIFVLGYFFMSIPAIIVGFADQAFDFTKRRAEMDEEEKRTSYDPNSDNHR